MEKYAISTLLTILHLLMIICVNTKSLNSSTDEHALLAFKAQITSDPSNLLAKNWSRGTSFCNWIGVTCGTRHRRVRVLNLSNMGLIGSIPIEIGNLSKLKNLNLSANNLTGALPSSIFNISSLVELRLRGNKISGEFPKDPCRKPTKLEVLDLGSNSFHGQIPSTLLQCRALKELSLSSNGFTGSIPNGIEKLSALQWLTLDKNRFTGSIPYGIGNLSSLQYLYLDSNMLTGSIPYGIGNLSSLRYLYLDSNMLTGSIPHGIGNLSSLQYLFLDSNMLAGPFKNFTADLFMGNSKLCGDLQFGVMRCKANSTSSLRKSRLLEYILPPVALVTILVAALVYLIRSRNRKIFLPDQSPSLDPIRRISYYEVLNATNKFAEESIIGRGSIGSVYKGIFSDGTITAIKVFNLDLERSDESFHTECQILCKICHRNLVKVISSCSNLDLKALILEYMPNGDLNKRLTSSNCNLTIARRLEMMIDVACAMEYLHHGYTSPIVHCDLKPSNILLDEDMVAHISDFGIAKLFSEEQRISLTKTLGTFGYMAPEYGSTGLISTMADVYSYGIVLMETFTRKKPTDDMFVEEFTMRRWVFESFTDGITQIMDVDLVNAVEDNIRARENCLRSIMELALECTTDLPEERLDMKDVLTRLRKIKFEFCK